MQDYYAIHAEEFNKHSKIKFHFVETHHDLCQEVARELVHLIRSKSARGEMTKVILPVGPLDYGAFAELCNQEGVSCESLVVFSMDEFCYADDTAIPIDHPLSFRAFYSPPREETDLETFKNTTVRIVELREGDMIQMAMGGTAGNIEMIPPKGCTVGIKELLSVEQIHLTFVRSWHAGVLRRALFGPVTPSFPGSLVQLHPNVKATITGLATALPPLSILQNPGK